jgi:hypothetical protein
MPITFLDLERNICSRHITIAGRCHACGETFTAQLSDTDIIFDSAEPSRSDLVMRVLELTHRCQARGAA